MRHAYGNKFCGSSSAGSTTTMMETVTLANLAVCSMCAVAAKAPHPSPSVCRMGKQKSQNKVNETDQPTPLIYQLLKSYQNFTYPRTSPWSAYHKCILLTVY